MFSMTILEWTICIEHCKRNLLKSRSPQGFQDLDWYTPEAIYDEVDLLWQEELTGMHFESNRH